MSMRSYIFFLVVFSIIFVAFVYSESDTYLNINATVSYLIIEKVASGIERDLFGGPIDTFLDYIVNSYVLRFENSNEGVGYFCELYINGSDTTVPCFTITTTSETTTVTTTTETTTTTTTATTATTTSATSATTTTTTTTTTGTTTTTTTATTTTTTSATIVAGGGGDVMIIGGWGLLESVAPLLLIVVFGIAVVVVMRK